MRKLYVILLFFSLLFSISCNSYKYGANAEPTQKSNLTFGVVKSKIIKGNTTHKQGGTDFLFGARASQSSSTQSFDLIITFDSNDIVSDYSVISTSY